MAYTQTQLDALEEAIALGVTVVRYPDGKTVQYRSLAEMEGLRSRMKTELGQKSDGDTRRYVSYSKGL